jgi:hypothetical protein
MTTGTSTGAAADHETRLFVLGDGDSVQPLAHARYVALARHQAAAPEWASQRLMLVDWYVRLAGGQPEAVVNETCSWLVFDAQGRLDLHAALAIQAQAAPSEAQWAQIRAQVFGAAAQPPGDLPAPQGLSSAEAAQRLAADGPNLLPGSAPKSGAAILREVITEPTAFTWRWATGPRRCFCWALCSS